MQDPGASLSSPRLDRAARPGLRPAIPLSRSLADGTPLTGCREPNGAAIVHTLGGLRA